MVEGSNPSRPTTFTRVLAGLGFDKTQSKIISDPAVHTNSHNICVEGEVAPGKENDGQFLIQIYAGGWSTEDKYQASRYFALNGLGVVLTNGSNHLASYRIDRNRKLGYSTESYDLMDNPNLSVPHFLAPLGEQEDVFNMSVVLPRVWLEKNHYDWSKDGSISIDTSSIWKEYSVGHSCSLTIPLHADK